MSTHEHIIIIVLKEKIQFYELKGGRPEILRNDKEDYLQVPSLSEAIAKIKDFLCCHYKKDGWHCFKFTVIYEKYNIETVRLFAVEFENCARLDFISAETLITMNSGKIKPPETGVVKFGESLFRLEGTGGGNNGEGGRQLLPLEAFDGKCGEITSKEIVLYAASGGAASVIDTKKMKELENKNKELEKQLKNNESENSKLKAELSSLKSEFKDIENKMNECSSLKLYKELCEHEAEFNRIKEYIDFVAAGVIDKNKISFSDFRRGKRPVNTVKISSKKGSLKEDIEIKLEKNVDLKLKLIPPGEFWIGGKPEFQDYSKGGASAGEPPLKIIITKPFYMGIYPVTQAQWLSIMKNNPSKFQKGGDYPVENVSWDDCQNFIEILNKKNLHDLTEWEFRLPTEAEWEYACRAGSDTQYYWGNKFSDKYCWYSGNSSRSTQPVGKKKPNNFGLFDMSGNVWEWCEDGYELDFYNQNFTLNNQGYDSEHYRYVEDPLCEEGSRRVIRGGSWYNDSVCCRSAHRGDRDQSSRYNSLGFRLALSPGRAAMDFAA